MTNEKTKSTGTKPEQGVQAKDRQNNPAKPGTREAGSQSQRQQAGKTNDRNEPGNKDQGRPNDANPQHDNKPQNKPRGNC